MNTGSRALHDMNGFISMVISRLLRLSIVREAMIAGIGSASCGPMLLEKYQLKETEISFDVRLKPELL